MFQYRVEVRRPVAAAIAAVAALAMLMGGAASAQDPGSAPAAGIDVLNQLSLAFERVAGQASPAVVHIEVEKEMSGGRQFGGRGGAPFGMPDELWRFFEPFHGQRPDPRGRGNDEEDERDARPRSIPFGQGSGFIISADGYIVTNHHVVGDADTVKVTLNDGREFKAETVGSDPQTEIALIKIEAGDLPTLSMGDSDATRVGQWVLAIGSPFGLDHSVTSGIISARGRSNVNIVDYADFIQTDAAINPGNSGGPLMDLNGNAIGVNTAIYSRSGGYMGIGFAVPINMAKYVVDQLREHGSVQRGFLGVGIQNLTPEMSKFFGNGDPKGIIVSEVQDDSPAAQAGVERDDIIIELDGRPVEDVGSFRSRVASTRPGTEVKLGVLRGGDRKDFTVALGTLPGDGEAGSGGGGAQATQAGKLGLGVQNMTDELAQRFGYEGEAGVLISEVEPGSPADRAGLEAGQLISEVNRKPVNNVQEFKDAVKESGEDGVLLRVQEGEMSRYVVLKSE